MRCSLMAMTMRVEEVRALDELADRLHTRFPAIPTDGIKHMVEEGYHQFDSSLVRDFIPVLVEREVTEQLRAPRQPSLG